MTTHLVTPHVAAERWLGPLKGFTAHQANRILGRHCPFWQEESYDHLVRNEDEFRRTRAELFPWSSAAPIYFDSSS